MSGSGPVVISLSDSDTEPEDDPNLPSRDECEARSQTFVEITGTDSALAMFYLQDREWNVDRALNDYFADKGDKYNEQSDSASAVVAPAAVASVSIGSGEARRNGKKENLPYLTLRPPVVQPQKNTHIRILSWNIDGLDPDNLQSRTEGACSVLLQEHPEIIFLQEVVGRSLKIIQEKCSNYQVFPSVEGPMMTPGSYFTAVLLRKDGVRLTSINVADFPTTLMSRNLLEIQCQVRDIPMTLLTSHLESTVEHSAERKKQLAMCFERMLKVPDDQTVIFGGDLNLRDKELSGLSAKPANILDIWEVTGRRKEAQFTWDLVKNDNKQLASKFSPRCRFDRLYLRHAAVPCMNPVYFELVGIQRLASCRRYPSDHWGILAHLDVLTKTH
ncbi:hypothetical protein BsWGS_22718 [Bradybaena similaris]